MLKFFKEKVLNKRVFVIVVALLAVLVTPVVAAVQLNLFTETTPTVTDCVTITAGADASNDFVTINVGDTLALSSNNEMTVTQAAVGMDALLGGRNNYTELLTITNTCSHDVDVKLSLEADPNGTGPIAGFADLDLREYISSSASAGEFDFTTGWNGTYIDVESNGTDAYTTNVSETGVETIPSGGGSRVVGAQVDVDVNSSATDTATFYVTVVVE
jgi:hypothetical protein